MIRQKNSGDRMTNKNVEQIFDNYVSLLKSLASLPGLDLSNDKKLQLYGLYFYYCTTSLMF
jgi:hypothetical protein